MKTIEITVTCRMCGMEKHVIVPEQEYRDWCAGIGYIQTKLGTLSEDDRELLISQTCSDCWEEMFPHDDE